MNIYLKLFLSFFHIGAVAFGGGYAVLPFLEEIIVKQNGWLTHAEILDVITISQMTPGPIAINAATFVGTKVAGLPGSIVATLGNITPQLIIMSILAKLVFSDKKITFMDNIIKGLKPGMVGLIFVATLTMIHSSIFNTIPMNAGINNILAAISIPAAITFIVGFILHKKKFGIIKIILISAIIGILLPLALEAVGVIL